MPWTREQKIAYAREYYKKNREEVLKKKRERESDPDRQRRQQEYFSQPKVREHRKKYTQRKRSEKAYIERERRTGRDKIAHRRSMLNKIQLYYGCCNPCCEWGGEYQPGMLDFHHLDPSKKSGQVSMMLNYRLERLASEINKCVVLCRNCHVLAHLRLIDVNESMLCNVNENLEVK